jgi:hypothetical protein
MKRLTILALFSLFSCVLVAQINVDGKDINADDNLQYIEILGADIGVFKKKIVVVVDYGQKVAIMDGKDSAVKDASGKVVIFNSMIDALNFFVANGWEYVNSYAVTITNTSVYHYLLRRVKK